MQRFSVGRTHRAVALSATVVLSAALTPIAAAPVVSAQAAHTLLITEYVEGTSFNKAVEITNTGDTPVDLAGYAVEVYSNGSTSTSSNDRLAGMLAPGSSFVYGSSRAVFPVDQGTGAGLWNGDDAIVLRATDGGVVDSFGQVGFDPGTAWTSGDVSTLDRTLRRIVGSAPDTDPSDVFDPASQWTSMPVDTFDGLGRWPDEDPGETPGGPGDDDPPVEGPTGACGEAATAVGAVQGSGSQSPMVGQAATVEGIVVGDMQTGGFRGFYLQDGGDGDAATSDGVFVFAETPAVSVGDRVRLSGTVSEHFGMTQIQPTAAEVCATGQDLPAPTELVLPIADRDSLEQYEGMRVTLPQQVTIIEAFNYDRFGQIVVSTGRQFQPTNQFEAGSPEARAMAEANAADRIMIDDGRSTQNPDPAIHPDGTDFTIDHRFRMGDHLDGVTGVLDYRFDAWAIQPTQGATHSVANPRPAPPVLDAPLTVAGANVLNYFTTLRSDDRNARGALDATEFRRQEDKIVAMLADLDADVVGLTEIENNDEVALRRLVGALNARVGEGTYRALETGRLGTDAITTAFIYKPAAVSPEGDFEVLDETVDPRFVTSKSRPALAQVFTDNASGEDVTVVVNHLKSKGSACTDLGDPEDPDGQGNCNGVRTNAARALADWLEDHPQLSASGHSLVIGDLNAYAMEDPILALNEAGYVDVIREHVGPEAYTYVFDGQLGYLDHALASAELAEHVTDVAVWTNNADEPDLIDYTMEFKKDAQDAIYAPDAYRASDHDPVLVGLDLSADGGPGDPGEPTDPQEPGSGSVSGFFGSMGTALRSLFAGSSA
ncbi:MAG: ExeM/NucH family extracellular endonuclease [Dietzia sp.]